MTGILLAFLAGVLVGGGLTLWLLDPILEPVVRVKEQREKEKSEAQTGGTG